MFALGPQFTPGAFATLLTTGLGGGAVAVPLIGVLGGFAVAGRGPLWGRILAAVPALALMLGGAVAYFGFNERILGLSVPRGVWVGLLFASLMVVFAFACSIPHRPVIAAAARV